MKKLAIFVALVLASLSATATAAPRPNIILIMADDMGYSDIGCYGGEVRTPNLDKLASEGLRFTQFYNAARCCPTRASLLTGLYPHQAGMGGMVNSKTGPGPYQGYLNDRCVTMAEVLKDAGYTTLMSGKWHVGEDRPHWPVDRGFDRYFGLIGGAMNYFDIEQVKNPGEVRKFAIDGEAYDPPNKDWYLSDAITDNAVSYLREYGGKENPFFLYVAYTAPHWPLNALEEDIQRYLGKYSEGWDALRKARYQRMIEMGIIDPEWPLPPRDGETIDWESVENKADMDRRMAVYAAQIDRMDQGIGRVLAALDETGKGDNTLVLFLSDNGGCHEGGALGFDNRKNGQPAGGVDSYMSYGRSWASASNTPFRMYKHWVHEGGISTPLIARWPSGIPSRGGFTQQPGHLVDIMATVVELAGATYPQASKGQAILPMEGRSLVPAFRGEVAEGQRTLYWEHMGNRAVRQGDWKLVAAKGEPWELYNLVEDRSEMKNRIADLPEKAAELQALYDTWAAKVGVKDSED